MFGIVGHSLLAFAFVAFAFSAGVGAYIPAYPTNETAPATEQSQYTFLMLQWFQGIYYTDGLYNLLGANDTAILQVSV